MHLQEGTIFIPRSMNYTVSFDIPEKRGSRIKRIYFVFYVAIVGLVFMATILLLRIYPNIITPYIPPSGQVHSVLQKSPILRTPATPNTYSSSEKRNIYAFGVEWDDSILTSIRESQDHIDTLIMEELTLTSSGMVVIDPEKFKKTKEYLATYAPHLPLYALINNHNQLTHIWDTNIVYSILSNKVKRRNLELKLRAFSLQNHLAGINIDFEALDQKTYPYYVLFIKEL